MSILQNPVEFEKVHFAASGQLLGCIVSSEGIQVDPFNVEVIIQSPPPSSIQKLQSFQGKANFLRIFIANYVSILIVIVFSKKITIYEAFLTTTLLLESHRANDDKAVT